jgi:membrane protein
MGVTVALILFLAASGAFSFYVANVGRYESSYGSLGTVVVTMLWFYVTTTAILVGAEIDAFRTSEAASTSRPVERNTQ